MDWSNERYVRLYTRDSLTWKLWPWQSRAIFCALLRKVDRAGVLDVGDHDPALGVAAVTEIPPDVVVEFLPALTSCGAVTAQGGTVAIPGFLAAQEARYSDRQRQAESRANRRARAVTKRDEKADPVTDRHTASQSVTPYRTVPSLTVPKTELSKPKGSTPRIPADCQEVYDAMRDGLRKLNPKATGPRHSKENQRLVRAPMTACGATLDDWKAVIAAKVAEGMARPESRKYLRLATLGIPKNFQRALDDIAGGFDHPEAPAPDATHAPEVWATS